MTGIDNVSGEFDVRKTMVGTDDVCGEFDVRKTTVGTDDVVSFYRPQWNNGNRLFWDERE